MKVKRIVTLALAAVLGVSLAACKDKVDLSKYDFDDPTASVATMPTSGTPVSLVGLSTEKKTEALGKLERFAVENFLTGMTLYENSGYGAYNQRLIFPTDPDDQFAGTKPKYVTGYGFGVLSEGVVTGQLSGAEDNYKTYYHTYETSDPATILYMNDMGSVVGSLVGYVGSSYYSNRLTSTAETYEWFPSLAKGEDDDIKAPTGVTADINLDRPIPMDKDYATTGTSNTYRIYVRTGKDGLVYATMGKFKNEYNGKGVALEDYVTPYKMKWTQKNGMARATEDISGNTALVGAAAYYNASGNGYNEDAWKNVGLKTGSDSQGEYLEFTFIQPQTPFYAMYYLSSSMFSPIPQSFIDDELGGDAKLYGSFNSDKSLTPKDTTLSLGSFVIEAWTSDQEIVFKHNDSLLKVVEGKNQLSGTSFDKSNSYKLPEYLTDGVPGIYVDIVPGAGTDKNLLYRDLFLKGQLDACSIPSDFLKDYIERDDLPVNAYQTEGDSTFKLNFNTCTQEEWNEYFGPNGIVAQNSTWEIKPAMSNEDFLAGLVLSVDRDEYAANRGVTPSVNYFSDVYQSDPENAESYNSTDVHANALKGTYLDPNNFVKGDGDVIGDSSQKAVEYFKKAIQTFIEDDTYGENDTITIEICWMYEYQINDEGKNIEEYMEKAFKAAADALGVGMSLDVVNTAVTTWDDVYYAKMMIGEYDIAFGSISGNTLNPLNFMEVLKSDNSSGFTLNYGYNTNSDEKYIEFDSGVAGAPTKWTYDALYDACDRGALVEWNGTTTDVAKLISTTVDSALRTNVATDDGGRHVIIYFNAVNIPGSAVADFAQLVLCWYEADNADGYDEIVVPESQYTITKEDYYYVIDLTLTKEQVEAYQGEIGFDLYFNYTLSGSTSQVLSSLYGVFPYLS